MAVHINMAVREHEDRRVSLTRAQLAGYTEATGLSVTEKHTGPWAAMLERTLELAADAATKDALSLDLERHGGEVGELTVTRTEYRQPSGGEEAELGTAENPQYTCSFSSVAVPLLTHPKFAGIAAEDMELIKEVENGVSLNSVVTYKGVAQFLRDALNKLSGAARVAANYYYKGVMQYYTMQCEATARWKGSGGDSWKVGAIVQRVPGNVVTTPEGCNWRVASRGCERNGKDVWQTATFVLSAPGGWDEYIYS